MSEEKREIGIYIDRTYKKVRQDLINRFKRSNIQITPEQWSLMWQLYKNGKHSQTELASFSFKDKPTVSRIIELLINKGFVVRTSSADDKRVMFVELTEDGIKEVEKAHPQVVDSRDMGWQGLSNTEYDELIRILDKIFTNYDK